MKADTPPHEEAKGDGEDGDLHGEDSFVLGPHYCLTGYCTQNIFLALEFLHITPLNLSHCLKTLWCPMLACYNLETFLRMFGYVNGYQ